LVYKMDTHTVILYLWNDMRNCKGQNRHVCIWYIAILSERKKNQICYSNAGPKAKQHIIQNIKQIPRGSIKYNSTILNSS
jgi:hypothetical protein